MTDDSRTDRVRLGELTFDVTVAGPDDGTPILLLHGFPESSASWRPVTPRLVRAGLRVIAPNQRGYSPDARPERVDEYRFDRLVGDVVGLLDAYDIESAHLVGHDWGAAVAWQVAGGHPERIRSLTAVSVPHPAAFGWALREDADQQRRSGYIGLLRQEGKAEAVLLEDDSRRLRAMFGDGNDPELVEEHVRLLSQPGALTAAMNWYRAMTRAFGDLPPVRVPTTYVWSTADPALGPAAAKRCAEFVDAPYRFVVLDGASHWIPEEHPDALADAILARVAQA
ncbi:alpha/beta fold hydrolase [Rhodococcus hoagii]|jgi:pimeloyl-ACP methyl ester carboxylesterase|uniref:Hydrolase, alpha/beta domain protein n=3 Tax=Rhodococcus hoagii TaxID=43767 RepID=E9T4M4_RHOHA|nr:alpha/beta hydrolase [Prescottella equi]EGD22896.1 hydrolase, alpha/beta domain protein [Prescottella equi ATCC 33707]MBM4489182.1 alpha/beta fold hydrolase [Prescottella equi]MBM4497342.1 alpha/beta fold hydrolase [Prescottella equi]MBM4498347.1 alpha/beta fold hydrolase [Prescottella equi]MBM4507123.1 alpha/beta fold hydrolase [Prescottella equi]